MLVVVVITNFHVLQYTSASSVSTAHEKYNVSRYEAPPSYQAPSSARRDLAVSRPVCRPDEAQPHLDQHHRRAAREYWLFQTIDSNGNDSSFPTCRRAPRGIPRQAITGVPNKLIVTGGTPRHVHSRSKGRDGFGMRQEERWLLPHESQQLVQVIGSRCAIPRTDTHGRIHRMNKAKTFVVNQLPFLTLLDAFDRQTQLFLELVIRTVIEVRYASVHTHNRLHG